MHIREMKIEDCQQIAQLENAIFSDAWSFQAIEETFSQKNAFIVVAEEKSVIVGYIICYHVLDEAEIARIAVDAAVRKEGVGGRLLEFCEQKWDDMAIHRVLLDVREGNLLARSFYEKHHFQVDGVRKHFYEQPKENAILMSKRR